MPSIMDEIYKIPPVTRFLCASTLGVSVPSMLQIISPYQMIFIKELVTERLEVWRPFTSMFFAGTGLSFIFDFVMLYRNSDAIESMHYAGRSADYAWQLFLNALGLLALNLPLRSFLHFRPLLLSLITLSAQLSPEALTSIFGLITIPHKFLPYALVAMDLIMGGPKAAAGALSGVISGYVWWYFVHCADSGRPGAALGRAPQWLKNLMGDTGEGRVPGVGRVFNAAGTRARTPATSSTITGHNWGTGHRLGDS